MIELRNINFRYAGGTDAGGLVNIDLIIPDGQVILLCGQSGCGKTTLTRLVNGLIPNYYEGKLSGEVLLDGKNISRLPLYETAKYVGSVFQNPRTQFFTVDSTSELAFGCENQGLPKEEIIQRVKSTAKQFDMDNLLGKNIFSLSGGEKQKIACASVSASNPPIIVLDEPSSNLDMSATKDLRRMIQIWKQQGKTVIIAEHRLYYLKELIDRVVYFISAVLPSTFLGTLPIGMYLYWTGSLAPQDLVMCLILSLGIVGPLMNFTTYVNETKTVEYAVHDVDKLLHVEELPDTGKPVEVQSKDIQLQDVSFSYDKESGKQVLSHINLKIPEGKFTALVGPSGGGKSTIARLIARFWDVNDGKITIGGVDIRSMPLAQLADIVSFVAQDNFLFNCSIKENIRLGNPDATDEEVYAAAKAACCDEFIQKLDNGYDTMAGDAGNRLSGGEKQRISIARMILKNAPIVILDEATAFTDQENEEKIQQSIAALTKGKTLLVIAHRLSTIKNADQIIVLQNGQVENTGTHQQLLAGDALYRDMWEAHIGAQNWSAGSGKGGN